MNQLSEIKIINLDDITTKSKLECFDIVFDFTDRFSKNKLEYLEVCNYNSNLIFIDNYDKLSQLDPHDLEILYEKNMSIKFSCSNNYYKYNKAYGRTLNFIESMREKLINKYSLTKLVKKINNKSYELIEIINSKRELSDLLVDNNYNIVDFNF